MHFTTQVDFSRRFGKTIGKSTGGLEYRFKKHLKTLSQEEQRKLFNDNFELLIKTDVLLCVWLYYADCDRFFSEFKNYVLIISDVEFDSIANSSVLLGNMMDNFWLELNDPTLMSDYTFQKALEEYKQRVKKNGFSYNKSKEDEENEQFKSLLKNLYYRHKNKDLAESHFDMTQQLKYARLDDIIQSRTKEDWEILYSLRYIYKNVVNLLLDKKITGDVMYNKDRANRKLDFSFDFNYDKNLNENLSTDDLYQMKVKIEDLMMLYQVSEEVLEWPNPYSNKPIDTIEYFPRSTSKPEHDWAYAKYFDLENNAYTVVNNMINTRKRKRAETENEFTDKINKIKNLMEERNKRIENITKYLKNGIYYCTRLAVVIAIGSIVYGFYT